MRCAIGNPDLQNLVGYNYLYNNIQFLKDFESIKSGAFMDETCESILRFYFSKKYNYQPPRQNIEDFVRLLSLQKAINPIRDWLDSLRWDGSPRLNDWLTKYAGVEFNDYTCAVGRIVLIGAVKRIYEPGCKFDYMMILEGEQGTRKSTLVETLGGEWFVDMSFKDDEVRIIEEMRGAWIIEIADLSGFRKTDIDWLKSFLTRKYDRCRLAYGRASKDFPRQSIFIGTTNPSGDNVYLRDDTGNRRYLPVACGKIDIEGLRENRNQLFAEAVIKYKEGEKIYLESNAVEIATKQQQDRQNEDVWVGRVREYLITKNIFTTVDILDGCLGIPASKITLADQQRVGRIMRKLKWLRKQNQYGEWEYHNPNVPVVDKRETNGEILWQE